MSKIVYHYLLKKTGLSNLIKIGETEEDPYREEVSS